MTVNYSCDAMLSTSERYASLKFRRVSRWFTGDDDDARELVAFLALVPIKYARWVFQWSAKGVALAKELEQHWREDERVAQMVRANALGVGVAEGLRIFEAMRDGGWKGGGLPQVVLMTFQDAMKRHGNIPKAARALGVDRRLMANAVNGARVGPVSRVRVVSFV